MNTQAKQKVKITLKKTVNKPKSKPVLTVSP